MGKRFLKNKQFRIGLALMLACCTAFAACGLAMPHARGPVLHGIILSGLPPMAAAMMHGFGLRRRGRRLDIKSL